MWPTIAIASLILICLIVLTVVRSRLRAETWEKWANSRGFRYLGPPESPRIVGSVDQHSLDISTDPQSSDNEGGVVVVLASLGLNYLPEGLQAVGVPGFVGDFVRWQEETIETGDENFDRDVMIQGTEDQEALNYWTPERRQALLDLIHHGDYDHVSLKNSELTLQFRSISSGPEELDEVLLHLQETGAILDDPPQSKK